MNIYLDQTSDSIQLEYNYNEENDYSCENIDENSINRMIPSDKSITHRALFLSFLIDKGARVFNPLISLDTIATLKVIETLGSDIYFILDGKTTNLSIDGSLIDKLLGYENICLEIRPNRNNNIDKNTLVLNCMGSGTTARLAMGVVCAIGKKRERERKKEKKYYIDGSHSLRLRPMRRVVDILLKMGVDVENKDNLPILIHGIDPQDIKVVNHNLLIPSSQLKSMIILSYLNSLNKYSISLDYGSRIHTEEMIEELFLKNKAGTIKSSVYYDNGRKLEYIEIEQTKKISEFDRADFIVPKDPSSIIFFIILFFILNKSIVFKNVSNSRGRLDYIDILNIIGFNIKVDDKTQLVTDISIVKDDSIGVSVEDRLDRLKPFNISKHQIPSMIDEISSLIVLSGFIEGRSCFYGIEELKVKESDRIERSIDFLKMFGIDSKINKDSMGGVNLVVYGKKYKDIKKCINDSSNKNILYYDSYKDHRMAMIATVISMIFKKDMVIENVECVKESFPRFWDIIETLTIKK